MGNLIVLFSHIIRNSEDLFQRLQFKLRWEYTFSQTNPRRRNKSSYKPKDIEECVNPNRNLSIKEDRYIDGNLGKNLTKNRHIKLNSNRNNGRDICKDFSDNTKNDTDVDRIAFIKKNTNNSRDILNTNQDREY